MTKEKLCEGKPGIAKTGITFFDQSLRGSKSYFRFLLRRSSRAEILQLFLLTQITLKTFFCLKDG
jgi:hypothetical protein